MSLSSLILRCCIVRALVQSTSHLVNYKTQTLSLVMPLQATVRFSLMWRLQHTQLEMAMRPDPRFLVGNSSIRRRWWGSFCPHENWNRENFILVGFARKGWGTISHPRSPHIHPTSIYSSKLVHWYVKIILKIQYTVYSKIANYNLK
jgi:hypothetical protein